MSQAVKAAGLTCEGLERGHLKRLLADFSQIRFELWADVILLQAFADLEDAVGDGLWSRSWSRNKQVLRTERNLKRPWGGYPLGPHRRWRCCT